MTTLSGPALEPQQGDIKNLVIIFHGYGADGENLIDLGQAWAPLLPHTAFVAPNGLKPCEMGFGYQWFSLEEKTTDLVQERLRGISTAVSSYIKSQAEHYGVPLNRVALVGFSQGSMLAIHQGIYGLKECAGILGYSGGFTKDESLNVTCTPPSLLCHGESDDVVPVEFSIKGQEDLAEMGCESRVITSPDVGHEISEAGFKAGGVFLKEVLK